MCTACSIKPKPICKPTASGQVVSVDMMESPFPGFIAHLKEPLEQEDNGAGSYDGFTLVQSSRPRSANAGHGVQRVNIGSFKGKFYNLKSFEADFIDKMKSNDHIEQYYGVLHSDDYREQEEMKDPIAYAAKLGDGDL